MARLEQKAFVVIEDLTDKLQFNILQPKTSSMKAKPSVLHHTDMDALCACSKKFLRSASGIGAIIRAIPTASGLQRLKRANICYVFAKKRRFSSIVHVSCTMQKMPYLRRNEAVSEKNSQIF